MSATCKQIMEAMEAYAPLSLQEEWDNSGLLVGFGGQSVSKVLIALDLSDEVLDEAIAMKADMIVSHHPVIFRGIKQLNDTGAIGRRLMKLIKNNIAAYAAHTNLDVAKGGTNDMLFDALGLLNRENLKSPGHNDYPWGMGRVGNLPEEMPLEQFAAMVKRATGASHVTYGGKAGELVKRVGLCTGSGANGEFFAFAKKMGCQVYVTGDVTHHTAQDALSMGLCLVDATHYYSEALVNEALHSYLNQYFERNKVEIDICTSNVDGQIMKPLLF